MNQDGILYPLFEHLRRETGVLGVGDYLLALETLRAGQGLADLAQIEFVCRLLWVKSHDDLALFEQAFARMVHPRFAALRPAPAPSRAPTESRPPGAELPPINRPPLDTRASSGQPVERPAQMDMGTLPLNPGHSALSDDSPQPFGVYQLAPRPPLSKRDMAGIWRHLREMRRSGPLTELDVAATIDEICRHGAVVRPTLRARRRNQVRLLILLDRYGSMTPFGPLVDALVESIQRSGLLGHTTVCYFHNSPQRHLSLHPGLVDHRPLDAVLAQHAKESSVLIISDAGAAHGAYRSSRVEQTRAFLQAVRQQTYLYAWLNPLPKARWAGSSAAKIANFVPMWPIERNGLIDAVNVLRGQPFPRGVRLDA